MDRVAPDVLGIPQEDLPKHQIQVGKNAFASWNLVLAALSSDNMSNPMNKEELPESVEQQLAELSGMSLRAFQEIWSGSVDRMENEGKNPKNYEERIDDRFRNLNDILNNRMAFTSVSRAITKRTIFRKLLAQDEVWKKKFPSSR